MADKKITQLTNITGANLVDADEFVVVDISADETKAITLGELKEAFDSGSGFVRITGDTMTGDLALSGADVTFGDNDKAIFGASGDLQIYHDGANSYISDQGTGNLRIQGSNAVQLQNASGENYLFGNTDASVTIYYDNAPKLATTATGINVTGTVTADGLTVDGDVRITTNTATNPFVISRLGTLDQSLQISVDDSVVIFISEQDETDRHGGFKFVGRHLGTDKERLAIDHTTGDISFYEDTGTTAKFFWDASYESLDIGSGLSESIKNFGTNTKLGLAGSIILEPGSGNEVDIFNYRTTNLNLGTGGSADMTIDSSGRVGVNTTSPATELDVQGTTTTNGLNLDAISETIDDTAVDVFVYDTSKDSDGGAWRKRTQGTSWYNETLNTSTRGSRKEFPAVAVIVAESSQVTIYDGDDPDLPMWMVFNRAASSHLHGNGDVTSIAMLNGELVYGKVADGSGIISFVEDTTYLRNTSSFYKNKGSIEQRNDALGWTILSGGVSALVNSTVNDVAMTVLPNAPIDAATGLPVPTIAVATDGGVSVIKDDGTVVDITQSHGGTTAVDHLTIDPVTNAIYFTTDYAASGQAYKINAAPIPSADRAENSSVYNGFQDYFFQMQAGENLTVPHLINTGSVTESVDINVLQSTGEGAFAVGEGLGLDQILEDRSGLDNSMIAYTTSDYATGWMNGDIKLATLSDTDDTDVTGSDLVVNGDFATSSDWTIDGDSTGWSITGGVLQGSSATGNVLQDITTVVGEKYVISFEISGHSGTGDVYVRPGIDAGTGDYVDEDGLYSGGFTATSTTTTLVIRGRPSQPFSGNVDNVSVRLAEEDRSVNGNGLQVFGSITKNPVNSGADLVAYSGFSSSNYLEQPYNSGLDFGTGDFCYTWWANITSVPAYLTHFAREYHNGSAFVGSSIEVFTESPGGKLRIYLSDDGYSTYDVWNSSTAAFGVGWQHFAIVRTGKTVSTYINGTLDNSVTLVQAVASLDNANAKLYISRQANGGSPMTNGSLAIFRASATAPSATQIAKIYNDEKHLFQENAQATLYGSSDAVTALAYDDSTEILSVGTSSGRSDFQGLRRVKNTTNAVGAAISASNGLIVEE